MSINPLVLNAGLTVLRRIHKNDFDPNRRPPFLRGAFNPSTVDTDGLSVYVETAGGCTPELLASGGRKPGEYFIVRFGVSELVELGLSVVSTPHLDESMPGHCSIPELSVAQKAEQPQRTKEIQLRLTEIASQRIVLRPTN
jgi:hypothetical protein